LSSAVFDNGCFILAEDLGRFALKLSHKFRENTAGKHDASFLLHAGGNNGFYLQRKV
jgi:hypothetical protein